jgi:pyridinium-3,5-bisthiocarboxylic acid mononucleotide nickel chelatase
MAYQSDIVTKLETNLDDCPAELLGAVMGRLLAAGALDVWFTPIQMKKSRPGAMLSVLCEEECVTKLADILFEGTTAFGLRVEKIVRLKLDREFRTVMTKFGEIIVKLGLRDGKIIQRAPEFDSCSAAAEKHGVPVRAVFAATLAAAEAIEDAE